ncbi:MBL fold metallo-hydrolase [Bacillus massilinigeriensis]|uniref:MBL fold metallo-hydrolase n=1 Tax=Bacillus massilionigeriensis TaxID=1805475 RepID=UPI00096B1795|nr:MBL fold metallo-hydrolase [Bacillus massilionigeriensis]
MEYIKMPLGPLQTNCYIIKNDNNTCLIFDPGEEGSKVIEVLNHNGLVPAAILLTHAHFDHIGAVDEIREMYQIPVYLHENESDWLGNPVLNGSQFFMPNHLTCVKPANDLLKGEKQVTVGDFTFHIYETPGHSPGSVSFHFPEVDLVISGDALFQGSIGRTDLPGGDHSQLMNSIHEKLLTLSEETIVLPGHGPETTIRNEMDRNPFLNGF